MLKLVLSRCAYLEQRKFVVKRAININLFFNAPPNFSTKSDSTCFIVCYCKGAVCNGVGEREGEGERGEGERDRGGERGSGAGVRVRFGGK